MALLWRWAYTPVMAGERRVNRNGTIRQQKNGRFQVRLRVPGSLPAVYYPAPQTFRIKAEAQNALKRHNEAIDAGTWRHPDEIKAEEREAERAAERAKFTVGELAEAWLLHMEDEVRPQSLITYRSRIEQAILPTFADARLVDVTPDDVREWRAGLIRTRTTHYAEQSYDRLRALMNWAVQVGRITESPCQVPESKRTSTKSDGGRGQRVSPEMIAAIASRMEPGERLAVMLSAWCGLRQGEVLGLQAEHVLVSPGGRVDLNVESQLISKGGRRTDTTKSGKRRRVPVPVGALADAVVKRRKEARREAEGWMIPGLDGGSMSASTFYRHWVAACAAERAHRVEVEAEEIVPEGLRFHDVRHSALSMFADVASLTEVQALAGHSDAATTATYTHPDLKRLREHADVLAASLVMP